MKTVSEQFIAEQKNLRSEGMRFDITAVCGSESRDLTPYFVRDSLSRIEWRTEDTLITYGYPDVQLHLHYDSDIWAWLHDNNGVEITITKGFDFEKHTVFEGFVDRENLSLDTLGTIYVKAYSLATKVSSVIAGAPWWENVLPVRDAVEYMFNQLGVTDQTIKIKPIDLLDHAWSEFRGENWGTVTSLPFDRLPVLALTDHKFVFAGRRAYGLIEYRYTISMIEFDEDYTDYTLTTTDSPNNKIPVNIIRWGSDQFAVILGNYNTWYYKDNISALVRNDWQATSLYAYDYDFTQQSVLTFTTISDSGYTYYPLAKTIHRIGDTNDFVIIFNGKYDSAPYWIKRARLQRRHVTTNAVNQTITFDEYYVHPLTQATSGYYPTYGNYYFSPLCPTSDYNGDLYYIIFKYSTGGVWSLQSVNSGYNALQIEGVWMPCGKYIANDGGLVFDVTTNAHASGFWTHTPTYVWTTQRDNIWYLTGYRIANNKMEVKAYNQNDNTLTSTIYDDVIPVGYTVQITGFSYLYTHDSNMNFLTVMEVQDTDTGNYYHKFAFWADQWFPYVTVDYTDDSIRTVLDELAKAFCCIYHFQNNDTGIFVSRDFLPDETYTVDPNLRLKQWTVNPTSRYRIRVNNVTHYGTGERWLDVVSTFIPDSEIIRRGIAYTWYNFISEWDHCIEFSGDFLIQYEPFDMLRNLNPLDGYTYVGRVMNIIDSGNVIRFELRGKRE